MTFLTRLKNAEYVLLVQPRFHKAQKSRNHSDFCPLPLLKFASYLRDHSVPFTLVQHADDEEMDLPPVVDVVLCTTSFTYYSSAVRDCVQYYRTRYPNAEIICGGIYATLLPQHCKEYTGCDTVIRGVVEEVEAYPPEYDLVCVDYQILHTSRGCIRNCDFCATYKIEPMYKCKRSIRKEITKKRLIFYDNNLLANPYFENILHELIRLRRHRKITYCEAQSGIDARLLTETIAEKLYQAGFRNIQFAWDGHYSEKEDIKRTVTLLTNAGYRPHEIKVFILYNYKISYNECEKKRAFLSRLGVQTTPCRYIPPSATRDGYNPYKRQQTSEEYYIHTGWTDAQVRAFKRNCRQHNICKRYNWKYWTRKAEKKQISKEERKTIQTLTVEQAQRKGYFISDKEQEA